MLNKLLFRVRSILRGRNFAGLFFLLALLLPRGAIAAAETTGQLLTFAEPMTFRVYVPPVADADQPLPVLYLLHGQGQSELIWEELGLAETMDHLIQTGAVKPFLIVMPREERYLEPMDNSGFDEQIVEELIPFIRQTFHTIPTRECTGVGGISRGAVWAQILAFDHYDTFGVLGLHSLPATHFSDYKVFSVARDNQFAYPFIKIRMDIGTADPYLSGSNRFSRQLDGIQYPYAYQVSDGGHDVQYWRAQLPESLQWYSEQLQERSVLVRVSSDFW